MKAAPTSGVGSFRASSAARRSFPEVARVMKLRRSWRVGDDDGARRQSCRHWQPLHVDDGRSAVAYLYAKPSRIKLYFWRVLVCGNWIPPSRELGWLRLHSECKQAAVRVARRVTLHHRRRSTGGWDRGREDTGQNMRSGASARVCGCKLGISVGILPIFLVKFLRMTTGLRLEECCFQ